MGFVSYCLESVPEAPSRAADQIEINEKNLRIKTSYWEIRLNPKGGLASLADTKTGRSFLTPGKRSAFFAGRIDGGDCESEGKWVLERARGGAPWAVARESGLIGAIPYTVELTIRADSPRLDCRATFRFDGQKIGRLSDNKRDSTSGFVHEEKLRFKIFPAVGEKSVGVRDLPFAVAETTDRYVEGNYWTAQSDGQIGVAVFNRGTMGAVREKDSSFSVPLAILP